MIGINSSEASTTLIICKLSANTHFVSAIWKNCEAYSNKWKPHIWLCDL